MNLKKKKESKGNVKETMYYSMAGLVLLLLAAIVALLFACIPMGIVWFVLVGILEYSIPVRLIYWIVYGFTLIFVIIMALED
ncbi:putative membrane protein [Bacillus phage vB_BceM_Bc431v3]|uniref:Putative membrane protein n=1 Tax=Bacillus phage vB_BceM_Bc431v3 TaxID=1195072 RepID=M4HQ01_9CAUD|nr:hypothetical protein K201_gp117 [Bacillus phage vB_BceM_Bc431v3]AFQ96425.1 putative membrane protein [Bacillus phage vB_BceM_Bc431v3]